MKQNKQKVRMQTYIHSHLIHIVISRIAAPQLHDSIGAGQCRATAQAHNLTHTRSL